MFYVSTLILLYALNKTRSFNWFSPIAFHENVFTDLSVEIVLSGIAVENGYVTLPFWLYQLSILHKKIFI